MFPGAYSFGPPVPPPAQNLVVPAVALHKLGNQMGMQLWCTTQETAIRLFSEAILALNETDRFRQDWEYQLRQWLPQAARLAKLLPRVHRRGPQKTGRITEPLTRYGLASLPDSDELWQRAAAIIARPLDGTPSRGATILARKRIRAALVHATWSFRTIEGPQVVSLEPGLQIGRCYRLAMHYVDVSQDSDWVFERAAWLNSLPTSSRPGTVA